MDVFGIIADDLTGACDVGGAFAGDGRRVFVDLGRGTVPRIREGDVLIVDAGVRDVELADVWPALERALARMKTGGAELRMLKIDSTLRGPLGEVIEFALGSGDYDAAVVAPAFPEQGRVLVDGRLVVHGADVDVDLVAMLEGIGPAVRLTSSVDLPAALERSEGSEPAAVKRLIVVDAKSSDDLATTAKVLTTEPYRTLIVGSAGLARQIARLERPARRHDHEGTDSNRALESAASNVSVDPWILVVAGSPEAATRHQMEVVESEIDCLTVEVDPGSEHVLKGGGDLATMDAAHDVVLVRPKPTLARDRGDSASELAKAVAAVTAATREGRAGPVGLVLVGGDTASRVLAVLEVDSLELLGEVDVGMPISRLQGGPWDGTTVVTKAGGFGGPKALASAVHALARPFGVPLAGPVQAHGSPSTNP